MKPLIASGAVLGSAQGELGTEPLFYYFSSAYLRNAVVKKKTDTKDRAEINEAQEE